MEDPQKSPEIMHKQVCITVAVFIRFWNVSCPIRSISIGLKERARLSKMTMTVLSTPRFNPSTSIY